MVQVRDRSLYREYEEGVTIDNLKAGTHSSGMEYVSSIEATKAIRYELDLAHERINTTKLQKLLYVFYGFSLLMNGKRILDEQPKCYEYGPLFLKSYGSLSGVILDMAADKASLKNDNLNKLIKIIVKKFGKYTALKLQKLLYYAQAYYMVANEGEPLFSDDIEAWKY